MNIAALAPTAGLILASFLSAGAALTLAAWAEGRRARAHDAPEGHEDEAAGNDISFLFEGERLVDATPAARALLAPPAEGESDLFRLLAALGPRFPDLESRLARQTETGSAEALSADGTAALEISWHEDRLRLRLTDLETGKVEVGRQYLAALEAEAETLRSVANAAPFLVWRQDESGTVTWANAAYLDLAAKLDPDAPEDAWPPPRLFDMPRLPGGETQGQGRRATLMLPGETQPRWFECHTVPMESGTLFMAVAADRVVKAESSLRDFVHTLTKTFAQLQTGLAIFDRHRRLALFNPALTDLTGLRPDFLSARPTLQSFLDQLRERRVIPEPRDYKSWRQKIARLEAAAANGTYEETWALATGQTYRISGSPHPDGALALLIDDITSEISLTRRFRAELETGQAVIDSLEEAIAVFAPSGALTLCNAAYRELWGEDPSTVLGEIGINEATARWNARCLPTPVWGNLRDYIGRFGERAEWTAEVRMKNGQRIACRFAPIAGGATLAGFLPDPPLALPAPGDGRLAEASPA